LQADRKTIAAFDKEYELGQRSLIDLLNAQNQYFNAAVSLTSSRGVIVFADYQLLAAMGTLLEYLKAPPPVDAAPLDTMPVGLLPYKFPTVRVTLPQTGSEPLRVATAEIDASAPAVRSAYAATDFTGRWPPSTMAARLLGAAEWFAEKDGRNPGQLAAHVDPTVQQSTSYASADRGKPFWLLSAFPIEPK
jgi:adhesin transport system outer membrane protein